MSNIDQLVELIKNDERVIRYKKLEEIINNDVKLKEKISDIKSKQKEMLKKMHLGKENCDNLLNNYDELLSEVYEIPLLNEYLELQEEINEIIQNISYLISKDLNGE